jgi:cytochrome c-type biogenesis protein
VLLEDFATSFVLGLLTPLTAACVLPLYPGFLSYLSSQLSGKQGGVTPLQLGLLVSAGVIAFMMLIGLIFTSILQVSLTNVIGIISPFAFGILAAMSVFLILGFDLPIPQFSAPITKNPMLSAFTFGFFFGAIVIPCNPLFIAAFFAKSILNPDILLNIVNFLLFGLGISAPLIVFSFISGAASRTVIRFLGRYQRAINLVSGLIMLAVSLYYLIFVFHIFGG